MTTPICPKCGNVCEECKELGECTACKCCQAGDTVQPIPTSGHAHAFNLTLLISGLALFVAIGGIFTLNIINGTAPSATVQTQNTLEKTTDPAQEITTSVTVSDQTNGGVNFAVTISEE
ncbi:MAG: hypothetical protein ABIA47_02225 [bacterium]